MLVFIEITEIMMRMIMGSKTFKTHNINQKAEMKNNQHHKHNPSIGLLNFRWPFGLLGRKNLVTRRHQKVKFYEKVKRRGKVCVLANRQK